MYAQRIDGKIVGCTKWLNIHSEDIRVDESSQEWLDFKNRVPEKKTCAPILSESEAGKLIAFYETNNIVTPERAAKMKEKR